MISKDSSSQPEVTCYTSPTPLNRPLWMTHCSESNKGDDTDQSVLVRTVSWSVPSARASSWTKDMLFHRSALNGTNPKTQKKNNYGERRVRFMMYSCWRLLRRVLNMRCYAYSEVEFSTHQVKLTRRNKKSLGRHNMRMIILRLLYTTVLVANHVAIRLDIKILLVR